MDLHKAFLATLLLCYCAGLLASEAASRALEAVEKNNAAKSDTGSPPQNISKQSSASSAEVSGADFLEAKSTPNTEIPADIEADTNSSSEALLEESPVMPGESQVPCIKEIDLMRAEINRELSGEPPRSNEVCEAGEAEHCDEPEPELMICEQLLPRDDLGLELPGQNRFVKTRLSVGNYYISISDNLDRFLSGRHYRDDEENESRLALSTRNTWFEDGHHKADVRVKASVDLPNTENRYKLFLESDPREDDTLEGRTRPVSTGEEVESDSSVLGLELSKKNKSPDRWKKSLSLGARFRSGIKPLVRARARKYLQLNEDWHSYFRQDIWHLEGVGWGETTRWELTRPLTDTLRFQWMGELEYRDEDDPLAYANTYQIFHQMNEDLEVVYIIGLIGEGNWVFLPFRKASINVVLASHR